MLYWLRSSCSEQREDLVQALVFGDFEKASASLFGHPHENPLCRPLTTEGSVGALIGEQNRIDGACQLRWAASIESAIEKSLPISTPSVSKIRPFRPGRSCMISLEAFTTAS